MSRRLRLKIEYIQSQIAPYGSKAQTREKERGIP